MKTSRQFTISINVKWKFREELNEILLFPITKARVAYKKNIPILVIQSWEHDILLFIQNSGSDNISLDRIVDHFSKLDPDRIYTSLNQFVENGYLKVK